MQIYINKINTLTLCILLLFSSNFTQTSSTNVGQMSEEETCKTAEDCFILATFYEQTNRREFAKSAYSDSIRLKPNFAEAYFARGKIYASVTLLGSSETYSKSAIADFTKFIRLRPKSPLGYAYRGLTYKDGDEYQLALADFDKCIELSLESDEENNCKSDSVSIYYKRSESNIAQGNYKVALEDINKAIGIEPKDFNYRIRGKCYLKMNDLKSALEDFTKVIELDTYEINTKEDYTNRAIVYRKLGKITLAKADELKAAKAKY